MKKTIIILSLFLMAMFALNNCSNSVSSDENTGTLSISLTDAPAAYDSVIIVFSQISAHIDSEWVHVVKEQVRVNLLDWSNGETMLLGSEDVPAGKYTQIRIKIEEAYIGVAGEVHELVVPSGSQTGLKLGPQFTIKDGSTYHLVLDFDAGRSIVVNGPAKKPKGYKLKPHIRVITEAVSVSISGTVTNPEDMPLAYAILGSDTITSSIVDTSSGYFKLSFLPENSYTVTVEDTSSKDFSQGSVSVQAGSNYDLGEISLD